MRKEQLQAQIEKVKAELLKLGPMRPGSLSQQYSACQKPGCKCVDPAHPQKHGPFYQLSYTHLGKSTTQFVRPQMGVTELVEGAIHPSRQEHHPVCSSSVCSGGAPATRQLQEIQSSHPAMGHPSPRALQARHAKSALGRPASGDSPPVLSFHLPGENSRIGPPFVFPHQDWLLVHFLHIFAAKNRST